MATCCVGLHRVNNGTWYVPNGKTKEQCTYCEWCVKNGCVEEKDVSQISGSIRDCNCDCNKKHPHIVKLICPFCTVNQINTCSLAMCSKCKNCGIIHGSGTHCVGCSYQLKICGDCGQPIKTGDEYISIIKEFVEKRINCNNAHIAEEYDGYYVDENKRFEMKLSAVIQECSGKTVEEMQQIIIENMRK